MVISARALFPIKRVCGAKKCQIAVCVCMACLRRGCRHFFRNGGYVDLATMSDVGISHPAPTMVNSTLLNVGHCGCEPITRAVGVARILARIGEMT